MRKTLQNVLIHVLIGLNVFILFFLLFENRIAVPPVLQVLGRMHPLLLHFPIVLLVLAWVLTCFGKQLIPQEHTWRRLVSMLLSAGALSTSLTVIFGLLLSREGGYEGGSLLWHKWTGVSLSFLAAGLLWYERAGAGRHARLFRPLFLGGMSVLLVILLAAGHLGAGLTHGEDYVFAPLRPEKSQTLDVETALVYKDVVFPVLESKCLSCHNNSKAKGELVLSDTASLLKGGESGPALAAGNPDESLLVERLLLEVDHEHHMPPEGKPQLTDAELTLIREWVASGAPFDLPLLAVPPEDTLRRLAEAIYGPPAQETFDFPAADAGKIGQLNTPFRVITPVSGGSPALSVSFFGKAAYHEESLKELSPLKEQIVSLNLSGMPVSGEDLNVIKSFKNLRNLNLNYTPVEDEQIRALGGLPELRSISLSGTALSEDGLSLLGNIPELRRIYAWNTGISGAFVRRMQEQHKTLRIERGAGEDTSLVLPLNNPLIAPSQGFFRDSAKVSLSHPIRDVELRYTLDGSEPDSIHSEVYSHPLVLTGNTVLKVKAFKPGWSSSQVVSRSFYRSPIKPDNVQLVNRPHPFYKGRGPAALFDLESGGDNHADGNWLGYQGVPLVASMYFDAPVRVDTVGLRVKQAYNEHQVFIYPPLQIDIWGGADSASAQKLASIRPDLQRPGHVPRERMINCGIQTDIRYLRVQAMPFSQIPEGFPAAGREAWLFIDEILLK